MSFRVPEQHRARFPGRDYDSKPGDRFGVFFVTIGRRTLKVIASDGDPGGEDSAITEGWEHVSVSVAVRGGPTGSKLPSWAEMCRVKALFWEDGDCVVQFHPAASDYVNINEVLHLWRHPGMAFPMPPMVCV
jgi:hypothetical protein